MFIIASALLVALGLIAPAAFGQSAVDLLPGPITTVELTGYADRLGLSAEQRLALEALHDDYKKRFRELADREIVPFSQDALALMRGHDVPPSATVKDLLERYRDLREKIALFDGAFLDQLAPSLTEQQAAMLPRIRLARQRNRYFSSQMLWSGMRPPVDLSAICLEVALASEERAAIEPTIADYERQLTVELRRLHDVVSEGWLHFAEAYERQALRFPAPGETIDDETMRQLNETLQRLRADVQRPVDEVRSRIGELNDRTCRVLRGGLSPSSGRNLHAVYLCERYPDLQHIINLANMTWFGEVAELEGLTDEQRIASGAAIGDLRAKLDAIVEEIVGVRRQLEQDRSLWEYDYEAWQTFYQRQQEAWEQACSTADAVFMTLASIVGEERFGELVDRAIKGEGSAQWVLHMLRERARRDRPTEKATSQSRDERLRSRDVHLPPGMRATETARLAEALHLTDDERAVLDAVWQSYVDSFNQLTIIDELPALNESLWDYDENTGEMKAPSDQAIEKLYRLRREAAAAIESLDDRFFDDVHLALGSDERDPVIDRFQLRRRHGALMATPVSRYALHVEGRWAHAATIDLVDVVLSLDLDDRVMEDIADTLAEYDRAMVEQRSALRDIFLETSEISDHLGAAGWKARQSGQTEPIDMSRFETRRVELEKATAERVRAIEALNDRTLNALTAELDGPAIDSVHRLYHRRTHPAVYEDAMAIGDHLTAAMELENLTDEQRRQLEELAVSYRPEYERLCRRLIELQEKIETFNWNEDYSNAEEFESIQRAVQRIRFDRNELSQRAINRLKAILSAEQIQTLGGLPEPPEHRDPYGRW